MQSSSCATTSTTSNSSSSSSRTSSSSSRQAWWKQSIVKRCATTIQTDLERLTARSPLLQQSQQQQHTVLPVFVRSEIQTGDLLGTGGFSQVHAIVGFQLDPAVSERCTPAQQALRLSYSTSVSQSSSSPQLALKHLKPRLVQSPKDFERAATDLALEGAYLSVLEHENILSLRGLPMDGVQAWSNGQADDYFLILDRLDGTLGDDINDWRDASRSSILEASPDAMARVADYSLQMAHALDYLHSKRIVFRDLKPHNVGISRANGSTTIQLFDFGLCRELPAANDTSDNDDQVYQMSGVGTRRYMAPESCLATQGYNCKVDVYAWSMVVWEMVTGRKPYATYGTEQHYDSVVLGQERPLLKLDWPAWVRTALEHAWKADVTDRWSMAQVVTHVARATTTQSTTTAIQAGSKKLQAIASPVSPVAVDQFTTSFSMSDLLELPFLPSLSFGQGDMPFLPTLSFVPLPSSRGQARQGDDDDASSRTECTLSSQASDDDDESDNARTWHGLTPSPSQLCL